MYPEILIFVLLALFAGLLTIFLTSSSGSLLLSLASELSSLASKNKFLDKFAQQISRLSLLSWIAWLILLTVSLNFVFFYHPKQFFTIIKLLPSWIWTGWLALAAAVLLFQAIYTLSWSKFKRHKLLHIILGLIALTLTCSWTYLGANHGLAFLLNQEFTIFDPSQVCKFFIPIYPTWLWPLLGVFFVLGLGSSGFLGLGYLLLRRNKDDFGRDYYRFSVPLSAKISYFNLLYPICYLWAYYHLPSSLNLYNLFISIPSGISLICLLMAAIIWTSIIKSKNPLRLKPFIGISCLLAWLSLGGAYFWLLKGIGKSILLALFLSNLAFLKGLF